MSTTKEKDSAFVDTDSVSDTDSVQSIDSVDSISTSTPGLPVNSDGYVPAGTTLRVCRSGSRCGYTGMVFALGHQQAYFAEFRNWNASAKRNEIVMKRGDESSGEEVGGINFHHWLMDQSRSVEITHEHVHGTGGETSPQVVEITRPHVWAKHDFSIGGRELVWMTTSGKGDRKVKRFYRRHLKCVDKEGKEVATFFVESYRGTSTERLVGHFEVQEEGLEKGFAEALLLTFLAVYVKLRKRAMQGMQAGNLSGLVTTCLYAVQG